MTQPIEQPYMRLATMSRWYVVSRAIHAVAALGVANHMSDTPCSAEKLAQATGTQAILLARLLNFLSAYQIFSVHPDGYALTELSEPLRDDSRHSIRAVLCMADACWWQAFSQLDTSLKTGKSAFALQHHDDFFDFLSKHPEKQKNFDAGMAKLSSYDDKAIVQSFDFSPFSTIVDMGGGLGGLSRALHEAYPTLSIILFDAPAVIEQLNPDSFLPNIACQAGDFLRIIPCANAYIFKGVLHDFNDEDMHHILKNCHEQCPKTATLFIAEQVMPDDNNPHPNKTMDIVMMVLLGGRQRTLTEWKKSIEPAGFVFKASYSTGSLFTLMAFEVA